MIDHLDNLLRQLFLSTIPGVTVPGQVRFQPPDENWRTYVSGLNLRALNLYLIDLRENRTLRSNESVRVAANGFVEDTYSPRRIDCHYLITAWSAAQETPAVEATLEEHRLLYQVMSALTRKEPLVPREVYAPAPLPATFPAVIADEELPTELLPIEGFPKYAEFWGTMGAKHPWKPAVWLVVTLPVIYDAQPADPMVTTRLAEFLQSGSPGTAETWIEIGGHVLDTTVAPPSPIAGVWVRLTTLTNEPLQIAQTNAQGRFTFADLRGGPLRLHAQAPGFAAIFRDIDVPSPTGEYDLRF